MFRYIIHKVCLLVLHTFLIGTVCFFALRILPGDAALNLSGLEATSEDINNTKKSIGLDQPVTMQYCYWLAGIMHGDLGSSYLTKLPVKQEILRRLPVTIPLSVFSFTLAILVSIPCGILAAIHKKDALGIGITGASVVGMSIPSFWIGIILVWIVALRFHLLPAGGFPREGWLNKIAALRSLFLPTITIAFVMSAGLIRYIKSVALDILHQDFIRTARSLGFSVFYVCVHHGLKNMLVPILTVLSIEFTTSLLGAVVIENVFALPGLGAFLLQGVKSRDFPVVQDIVLIITFFVLLTGFIVDIIQHWIDPRLSNNRGWQ